MALRYELRPFPLHKVAEDTVVVVVLFFLLVCFVSLSPSLVILARSAAFPRWCTDAATDRRESAQQSSFNFTQKVGGKRVPAKPLVSCRKPC